MLFEVDLCDSSDVMSEDAYGGGAVDVEARGEVVDV